MSKAKDLYESTIYDILIEKLRYYTVVGALLAAPVKQKHLLRWEKTL